MSELFLNINNIAQTINYHKFKLNIYRYNGYVKFFGPCDFWGSVNSKIVKNRVKTSITGFKRSIYPVNA